MSRGPGVDLARRCPEGRLGEEDPLVVIAEIGVGADQAGGRAIEGDQVAVYRERLGHGLGKKPHPRIVSENDLPAKTLQEGGAPVRIIAGPHPSGGHPAKGDDIHEVAVGIQEIDIHKGETPGLVPQGKLRRLKITVAGQPVAGKIKLGRLIEGNAMINAEHPEEEPFQPVRRDRVGSRGNKVLQERGIVGIQVSGGLIKLSPGGPGLGGKGMGGVDQIGVIPGIVPGRLNGPILQPALDEPRPVLGPEIVAVPGYHGHGGDIVDCPDYAGCVGVKGIGEGPSGYCPRLAGCGLGLYRGFGYGPRFRPSRTEQRPRPGGPD